MRPNRPLVLEEMLSALLREWGYPEVRRTLDQAAAHMGKAAVAQGFARERASPTLYELPRGQIPRGLGNSTRPTKRLSPLEYVARLRDIPEEKRDLLEALASRFEAKQLWPRVTDIRHFLRMRGEGIDRVKNRSEAFRWLLKTLAHMSYEELEHLLNGPAYSGPSQLGPIAEAIKTTASAMRLERAARDNSIEGQVEGSRAEQTQSTEER